jgi:hypothetical protein
MSDLKPGLRLVGAGCTTEVVVVRAPSGALLLTCCGAPMIPIDQLSESTIRTEGSAVTIGKRYVNADFTLEVLCTKPGPGPLAADGVNLEVKSAKPLPASD